MFRSIACAAPCALSARISGRRLLEWRCRARLGAPAPINDPNTLMTKFALLAALSAAAAALALSGCSRSLEATPEHCSADYIKSVADKEGLDKAKELTSNCLEKGYNDAKDAVSRVGKAFEDAGATLKEGLFGKDAEKK